MTSECESTTSALDVTALADAPSRPRHDDGLARKARARVRWRERLIRTAAIAFPARDNTLSPTSWTRGGLILLYHRVVDDRDDADDPFCVRCSDFADQVAWLSRNYDLVTAGELARRVRGGESVHGVAAITFDDGYECTFSRALPVLRAAGAPATVFVDTDRLNGPPPFPTAEQVAELAAGGIEIGSHTVSHRDTRSLCDATLRDELVSSKARLAKITSRPVIGFAYPFGLYDGRVERFVREAGYEYACTCRQHRTNHINDDPYRLTRIEINRTDNLRRFENKLLGRFAGVYAAWYRLDPATRAWVAD